MKIEEHIGRRVREHRTEQRMSQDELARRLETYVGHLWSRQAVSATEKGNRAFTAVDLVALAMVLNTTPGDLITPPPGATVDLPGGQFTFPSPGDRAELDTAMFARDLATLAYGAQELEGAMTDLAGGIGALAKVAAQVHQLQEGNE